MPFFLEFFPVYYFSPTNKVMAGFNRRLAFWLVGAYLKRLRKFVVIFFFVGLIFFFLIKFFLSTIAARFPLIQKEYIGVSGSYNTETIPETILQSVSHGLTVLDTSGIPKSDIASSWEISSDGKVYTFHLKHNQFFSDGTKVTSSNISYIFSDVKTKRPNPFTIVFSLKEPYSPFLSTVSRPIFKNGFVGINGDYEIKDIKLNGNFISSLTLTGVKNPLAVKVYQFYSSEEALKLAFVMGNISKALGLNSLDFNKTSFNKFPNAEIIKTVDYRHLLTLFYNTQDKNLSDKKLRDALSYVLPNNFEWGQRASSPLSPKSWAYLQDYGKSQDLAHAKLLLDNIKGNSSLGEITISTLPKYKNVAEEIKKAWAKIDIKVKINVVYGVPDNFQVFLATFNVPEDPDQYTLWHSDQINNITGYKSLRIDLLLEEGRKTLDQEKRLKIYSDFQKYLQDDQPATFLFFPNSYTLSRK